MSKVFRTEIGQTIFNNKYAHLHAEDWDKLSDTLVEDVVNGHITGEDKKNLIKFRNSQRYLMI